MFQKKNPRFKKTSNANVFLSTLPCNLKQSSSQFFFCRIYVHTLNKIDFKTLIDQMQNNVSTPYLPRPESKEISKWAAGF